MMDLLLGFFTGYFVINNETSTRELVTNVCRTSWNYVRNGLLLNLITCAPYDVLARRYLGASRAQGVTLRLVRMLRFTKLLDCASHLQIIFEQVPGLYQSLGKATSARLSPRRDRKSPFVSLLAQCHRRFATLFSVWEQGFRSLCKLKRGLRRPSRSWPSRRFATTSSRASSSMRVSTPAPAADRPIFVPYSLGL